jgi:hypothetical protein
MVKAIILFIVLYIMYLIFDFLIKKIAHYETRRYRKYIEKQTVFIFIKKPTITAIIKKIYWKDIVNPRMILEVKYPSGSLCTLRTTVNEFNILWKEII